jgi:L-serine dehydratase
MSVLEATKRGFVPVSVFQLFSIGIGPSSSHTVGPMRAARLFAEELRAEGYLPYVASLTIELFGSLAMTGKGHATDIAVLLGMEGETPEGIDPNAVQGRVQRIGNEHTLKLLGNHSIRFIPEEQLIFHKGKRFTFHSNAMRFRAFDAKGAMLLSDIYYSVGGGFVVPQKEALEPTYTGNMDEAVPYPFQTCEDLLHHCRENRMTIAQIMMENEKSWRSEKQIRDGILNIWQVMKNSVQKGIQTEGILPGGLEVKRRASEIYKKLTKEPIAELHASGKSKILATSCQNLPAGSAGGGEDILAKVEELPPGQEAPKGRFSAAKSFAIGSREIKDPSEIFDWVSLFALAVNEENAAGGRIVTAPTNGAAGIIPAVLHYYQKFIPSFDDEGVVTFFLTAAAVGILYKEGASLSAAEMGCQGEVGVATSMAAAGLTAALGGTNEQIENAAEIGMEHNLGLTCDPIAGLVQIPCIERNAMGAVKAINAMRLAMKGDGSHRVTLDQVITAMRQTGEDMQSKYKETSEGGLALSVPVNLPEC